jgi:lysozyme
MPEMKTSPAGIDLIKRCEGLRLRAYRDAVGVWTIGYGHTSATKPGMSITAATAEALLWDDLGKFEAAITASVDVPLNQNEFDALVSLAFNVGAAAVQKSQLLRRINQGNKMSAADQFLRWDHAGGKVLAGLTARRKAERELFLTPITTPSAAEDLVIDLPTLRAPFGHTAATKILMTAMEATPDTLEAAVGHFQYTHQLKSDGIVGPATWATLFKA